MLLYVCCCLAGCSDRFYVLLTGGVSCLGGCVVWCGVCVVWDFLFCVVCLVWGDVCSAVMIVCLCCCLVVIWFGCICVWLYCCFGLVVMLSDVNLVGRECDWFGFCG